MNQPFKPKPDPATEVNVIDKPSYTPVTPN